MAGCGFNIGLLDYFMEVAWMLIWFFFSQAFSWKEMPYFEPIQSLIWDEMFIIIFFGLKELRKSSECWKVDVCHSWKFYFFFNRKSSCSWKSLVAFQKTLFFMTICFLISTYAKKQICACYQLGGNSVNCCHCIST